METKVLEIRDRNTFIPALAVRFTAEDRAQEKLLRAAGYNLEYPSIQVTMLQSGKSKIDPYEWNDRTMQMSHLHIEKKWHSLHDGDVVDVEFILGETETPKEPQVIS